MIHATVRVRIGPRRRLQLVAAVMAATFILSFTSLSASAHASSATGSQGSVLSGIQTGAAMLAASSRANAARTTTVAGTKKAVIVVGPVGSQTAEYVLAARDIASVFTAAGMDVHLILPPNATWTTVVAVANGADFFAYLGHGNGWPSPYPPFQEDSKDGLGLNPTAGDTNNNDVKYYGANKLKASIRLAPNAIALLNRLCYADGNGEAGMPIPTQDVAFQRVDNFASGLLAIGARVVFALGWQPGADLADAIVNTHQTMDNFFMWKDGDGTLPEYQPWHGWIGWKPNVYLDSVRTAGASVHLDPHPTAGYLRAVTGDLSYTMDEWWGGGSGNDTTPPTIRDLTAAPIANTTPAEGTLPVFTPNGDGVGDSLTISQTLSEPAYLDVKIVKYDSTVVRTFTSFSEKGATSETWDGKNSSGAFVGDGVYTITVTPKDRAGNVGDAATTRALVLTTMRSLAASPNQFYAADGDALARTQTQSLTLDKAATLTWVVTTTDGAVVRTAMSAQAHSVGLLSWTWDGKNNGGAYVPDGPYMMSITATNGNGSYTQALRVLVSPFKMTATAWTAPVGQSITLTIITAEAQKGCPVVTVNQPGLVKFSVSLAKYSANKFTATFKFRSGGGTGPATIRVTGTDINGGIDTRTYTATVQ